MRKIRKTEEIIREAKCNAKAYNKHLTDEYLDGLPIKRLLGFCHNETKKDLEQELNSLKL